MRKAEFTDSKRIEDLINKCKNDYYEELVTPVHIFLIFNHEIAKQISQKKCFRDALYFKDSTLRSKATGHPSIVQWESIQIRKKECFLKGLLGFGIAVALSIVVYACFIRIY